jgi:hypothetical protein
LWLYTAEPAGVNVLDELKVWIIAAVAGVTKEMLQHLWQ